jgi:predicted Zn finger-like uncharacterized protein
VKFLCDNCKAKYQIADEKVAGKTVRMKCRKCGHQIEVRAAVTETSVASAPPRAPAAPRAPQRPAGGGLATSLSATKPKAPMASSPISVAPVSALAGAFKSNVQDAPESVSGEKSTIELSVSDEWYVAASQGGGGCRDGRVPLLAGRARGVAADPQHSGARLARPRSGARQSPFPSERRASRPDEAVGPASPDRACSTVTTRDGATASVP